MPARPLDYSAILDEIERAMGRAPRRLGWFRGKWRMQPPDWLRQDPDFIELFRAQDRLLKEGRLAWGVLVQANKLLFSTSGSGGKLNAPGLVLYSLDPASRARPGVMRPIGHAVFDFKAGGAADPQERALGAMLAAEMTRPRGIEIPRSLSPGYPTVMTSIFFDRAHLPGRKLSGALMPLLVAPQVSDMVMVAPHWFWPKAFIDAEWR